MNLKVALSHDWLNGMRGGEKCLEVFCRMFPDAPVYTLFSEKDKLSAFLRSRDIRASALQHFPAVRTRYRYYLPFFPAAAESFRLKGYDLVLSSSHCVAKGIRKNPGALHVCYCFTPMRYAWGFFGDYFGQMAALPRAAVRGVTAFLRKWDRDASRRVDRFIAISHNVKARIKKYYGRDADVIYPPVDTDFYTPDGRTRGDYYLIVSALVPYKRLDTAVRAFASSGRRLTVIGSGPESGRLKAVAGENISFLGWQSDEVLREHYRAARGLVFPGEEDFGIVPVEAQACGLPVIAYASGGALETVAGGHTGIFFDDATPEGLNAALSRFEAGSFDPRICRENALRFGAQRFEREMREYIERLFAGKEGFR